MNGAILGVNKKRQTKKPYISTIQGFLSMPTIGIEPTTPSLRVKCSTD